MLLEKIPEKFFEMGGIIAGFSASAFIALQVFAEATSDAPSTLSYAYVAGFMIVFFFWALYGFRFGRIAIWLTNFVAGMLQLSLLIIILLK